MDDKGISSYSYMRNDTRKNVLEAIFEKPGVTNKELSSKLGLDKSTISWHVNELQKGKSINFEKHGRLKRYYPISSSKIFSDHRVPVFSK